MIRSTRIPAILNRICTAAAAEDGGSRTILASALLVTADGELLGASSSSRSSSSNTPTTAPNLQLQNPESFGTLLADIAMEYQRLGEEFASGNSHDSNPTITTATNTAAVAADTTATTNSHNGSQMQCLLLEMEAGLVGIAPCGYGCLVMIVGAPNAPLGWIRNQLQIVALHIQESLSTTTTASSTASTTTSSTTTQQPTSPLRMESSTSVS